MADVKNTEMEIQKHLFIDDGIIENLIDVKRVLNQPRKYSGNPVLKPEDWEYFHGTSVLYDEDEKIYKMWHGVQKGQRMWPPQVSWPSPCERIGGFRAG